MQVIKMFFISMLSLSLSLSLSLACDAVFYKMAHKRLKQQSFHDSPPAQSRFSTLPVELKLKVLEYFSFEELHSRFNTLPIELKLQILDYFSFQELHSRFSTLPIELKLQILDYFSFEEAARTSILSSILSSTNSWSEHSQVILDKLLFEERGRWIDELHPSAWVNKVEEILNNHREGLIPIQKFVLHIPEMQYKWGLYINIWLSYLSSNSIKELSVDNCNIITYKLSSILFEWSELTRLMLRNCAFCKSFGSFKNLRFLHLEKIAFGSVKVGDVTLSTPSLVWAELVDCMGFRYLDIQAPKLLNFVVASATSFRMSRDDEEHMCFNLVKPSSPFIIGPYHSGSNLGFRAEFFFRPPNDTEVPEFEGFGPEGEPP